VYSVIFIINYNIVFFIKFLSLSDIIVICFSMNGLWLANTTTQNLFFYLVGELDCKKYTLHRNIAQFVMLSDL